MVQRGGIGVLQSLQQVPEQPIGVALIPTVVQRAGSQIKRPGQVMLRLGPGGFQRQGLGAPRCANLLWIDLPASKRPASHLPGERPLLHVCFECDHNLWDAVEVSMGRTQGVESHRPLGDYRSPHPPIRHRRATMTAKLEPMVQQLVHEFHNLMAYVTGPDARWQTAYTVELTWFRRLLALGAALLRLFWVTGAAGRPAEPVTARRDDLGGASGRQRRADGAAASPDAVRAPGQGAKAHHAAGGRRHRPLHHHPVPA